MLEKAKYNASNLLSRFFLSLLLLCFFTTNSHSQVILVPFLELTYGEHDDYDRFVFRYTQKPNYEVSTDGVITTLRISPSIDIKTRNLDLYPRDMKIKNYVDSQGNTIFVIPAPMVKNFEYQDKIVIDVKSYKKLADKDTNNLPAFIIDEIKVIEDKKPEQVVINDNLPAQTEQVSSKPADTIFAAPQEDISKDSDEKSQSVYEEALTNINTVITDENRVIIEDTEDGAQDDRRSTSLSFSWNDRVGLAVFKRNEYLWIVFDKQKSINLSEVAKAATGFASEVLHIPNTYASILRLKLKKNLNVSVRQEGLLWVIDLYTQKLDVKSRILDIKTQYSTKDSAYLFVPTNNSGDVVFAYDPDIGDTLIIATVSELNLRVGGNYEYADLNIIKTIQGLVIEPYTDDIIVTRNNSGIMIRARNRGLNISPDIELLKKQSLLLQEKDWILPLTEDLPIHLMDRNFILTTADLISRVVEVPREKRNSARIELAKYYVAKAMGAEAAGVLENVIKTNSDESKRENVHGLLGISYFLLRRYDAAINEFSYGRLPELNEAVFWKILSESAIRPTKENNELISSYIPVIRQYPAELKVRIAMVGIEIAIAVGDDVTAQAFADIIENANSKIRHEAFLDYWMSEILSIQGYPKEANKRLHDAARSNSTKYSALARKKLAILDYHLGIRTKEQTIDELERLKYIWGERDFKISLLDELYSIYISTGDYYNALKNMQILAEYHSGARKDRIVSQMVTLFENIFIYNQEGSLTPVQALALYNDFNWLIPMSEHYNQIVINLADRLVYVDLLDRAGNLLVSYVDNKNLSIEDRAQIGTRLALISIFNEQNEEALRYLDLVNDKELPDLMRSYRRMVRARALANMEKYNDAIKVLNGDTSQNAHILRGDIYWRMGEWSKAADSIKNLIYIPKEGEELNDEQASLVIDWITALRKAKKDTIVVFAKDKFYPFFKDSKYESAFNVLTNNLEKDVIDIKNIHNFINDVNNFSNFAKVYNESLGINNYIDINEQ